MTVVLPLTVYRDAPIVAAVGSKSRTSSSLETNLQSNLRVSAHLFFDRTHLFRPYPYRVPLQCSKLNRTFETHLFRNGQTHLRGSSIRTWRERSFERRTTHPYSNRPTDRTYC